MLKDINLDFTTTYKTLVKQSKQDPSNISANPFKNVCKRAVERFWQAGNLQYFEVDTPKVIQQITVDDTK